MHRLQLTNLAQHKPEQFRTFCHKIEYKSYQNPTNDFGQSMVVIFVDKKGEIESFYCSSKEPHIK